MTPPGIPTLSDEEIRRRLAADLPRWSHDGAWLRREVATGSWGRSLLLASRVAHVAEAAFHHPDLEVGAGRVLIRVRHHWAAGITESDVELAVAIERALAPALDAGETPRPGA